MYYEVDKYNRNDGLPLHLLRYVLFYNIYVC